MFGMEETICHTLLTGLTVSFEKNIAFKQNKKWDSIWCDMVDWFYGPPTLIKIKNKTYISK